MELAGERAPDGTVTAYEPALVELPSDVGPGLDAGTVTGSAGDNRGLHELASRAAAGARAAASRSAVELVLQPQGLGRSVRQQT